jgi:4-hydroxybenzoate polyprenyltransferase
MDRYLGADEDEENMPRRTRFVRKYGAFFFYSSILMYLISLILTVDTGLTAFSLTLFPVLLSILYSPLNLKKYIFVGNMIVGIAWGSVPLFIGSYYGEILAPEITFLSFFFTISWFRNATIFDIKDVKGDLVEGVRTIPNTYGIANTKFIAFLINIGLMITWLILILIGPLSYEFLVLISFHLYVLGYAQLLNNEKGEYYYSVIIDGECKALALFVALAAFVGLI